MLGDWDALNAVDMKTDIATYPTWTVNVEVPRGVPLEYKFFKKSSCEDGSIRVFWEVLQLFKRRIETHDKAKIILTEHFSDAFTRWEEIFPASATISPNQSFIKTNQNL